MFSNKKIILFQWYSGGSFIILNYSIKIGAKFRDELEEMLNKYMQPKK